MNSTLRLFNYMRIYWLSQTVAYVCMLGINAIRIYSPQLIRRIIDVGIDAGDNTVLTQSVILLVGVTVLQGVFRFGQGYLSEMVSQGIAYGMRNEGYRKLQNLSFSYHDRTQAGQLLSRSTSDVERLRRITGGGFLGLVDAFVLLIATTVVLVRMQPTLAVLSLLVMPAVFLIMRRFMNIMHPCFHERQDLTAVMTSRLEQNLQGVNVVRGFAQEDAEVARFEHENDRIFDVSMVIARVGAMNMPLIIFLASASTVLILWLGGQFVISGQLTLGELVAFNSYLLQLINPVRRMGFLVTQLVESRASAERVFEILDADSEVSNAPDAVELPAIRGEVKFDHVSFSYFGTGEPVLKDITFEVDEAYIGGDAMARCDVTPGVITVSTAYALGDVNGDGEISNVDLIMVARHIVHLNTLTAEQIARADMNSNGSIDNVDLIRIARIIVAA
jgi:ATP-binding cassette subfamily B protein